MQTSLFKKMLEPSYYTASVRVSLHRQMTPRPVQHGGGVELVSAAQVVLNALVPRMRADYGGELFTAKLDIVVH